MRNVKAQAATWGGDSGRVYLSGHSAGGHLAALTALRAPGVRGCLPLSGIMDVHHPTWYGVMVPASTPDDVVSRMHAAIARRRDLPRVNCALPGATSCAITRRP